WGGERLARIRIRFASTHHPPRSPEAGFLHVEVHTMSVAVLLTPEDKLKPAARPALAPGREVAVLNVGRVVIHGPEYTPESAAEIYGHVRQGRRVVAVVSAFGGETDRLLGHARELGLPHENLLAPAYVVQGEEQAAALTALACDRVGLDAVALTVRELGL